jgi:hypothetical protein
MRGLGLGGETRDFGVVGRDPEAAEDTERSGRREDWELA